MPIWEPASCRSLAPWTSWSIPARPPSWPSKPARRSSRPPSASPDAETLVALDRLQAPLAASGGEAPGAESVTDEQRIARDSLKNQAPGYRVTLDREGWPIVDGRYGQIEYHDGRLLAVFSTHSRIIAKLLKLPNVQRHQMGDFEARMLFPVSALGEVAIVVKSRRKRVLSSAALA